MRRSEALAEARVVGMGGRGVRGLVRLLLLLGVVLLVGVGEDGVRRFLLLVVEVVVGVGVLGVYYGFILVSCVCVYGMVLCGCMYSTYHCHVGFLGRGLWSSAVLVDGGIVDWGEGG